MGQYTTDKQRVIAHGMGVGGKMAYYLGFNERDLIRGVATTGAVLASPAKNNVANQPLAFFLVAGGKDPLKVSGRETKKAARRQVSGDPTAKSRTWASSTRRRGCDAGGAGALD